MVFHQYNSMKCRWLNGLQMIFEKNFWFACNVESNACDCVLRFNVCFIKCSLPNSIQLTAHQLKSHQSNIETGTEYEAKSTGNREQGTELREIELVFASNRLKSTFATHSYQHRSRRQCVTRFRWFAKLKWNKTAYISVGKFTCQNNVRSFYSCSMATNAIHRFAAPN